jgi:hypothetical protein
MSTGAEEPILGANLASSLYAGRRSEEENISQF